MPTRLVRRVSAAWLVCGLSFVPRVTVCQSIGDSLIRGINWGSVNVSDSALYRELHINLVHGSTAFDSTTNKTLNIGTLGAVWGPITGNAIQCERLTMYPSAPPDGSDSSKLCFWSRTASTTDHNSGLNPAVYSELFSGAPITFQNIQFGMGQFFADTVTVPPRQDSEFYITIRAKKPGGNAAHDTDAVFRVTVYDMRITGRDSCTHLPKVADLDSVVRVFRDSAFPSSGLFVTTALDSVTRSHIWQHNAYRTPYPDSSDVKVEFTGACNIDLYSVTLENGRSRAYMALPDSGPEYNAVKATVNQLDSLYGSTMTRYYVDDEKPVSFFEAYTKHNTWIRRALRGRGKSETQWAPASEIELSNARQFMGMAGGKEAWVGFGTSPPFPHHVPDAR